MDTTFYEDSKNYYRSREEMRELKRPMTLDLDSGRSSKKSRGPTALLTSPDLNMLKLASPELEKLIIANHGYEGNTPGQCMYNLKAEERGQQFARDFTDDLLQSNGLYQQQPHHIQSDINIAAITNNTTCNIMPSSSMPCSTASLVDSYGYQQPPLSAINLNCNPMVSSTMSSNNCYAPVSQNNGFYHEPLVSIKEEPQTVPCMGGSPPQSPIDMEDQERLKLERKRLRNRIAASKCRRRKLERIAKLEDKVSHLKNENSELSNHVQRLREQVCHLKQQVMDHVQSGCEFVNASTYPSFADDL
ncbi:transcription factor Jun-like [Parasteatoda tepidariorum]|uniref:transcription factor Jun-like n=1 Tax=Parasteatoda tepidariorum TaxID=114398 RepID=UPI00077FC5F7|nr:transcription factor AP-1-like [Parasteatoda tepidariorum]